MRGERKKPRGAHQPQKKQTVAVSAAGAESKRFRTERWAAVLLCAAVLVFYWTPLTSESASIQWDMVDAHYSMQKYFSDHIRAGNLPFWTPYIFSGYPFLADPQVGAWYPLNWPFFLAGITPRTLELELLVHALLACAGAYFLGLRLFGRVAPAIAAGLFYGLSGNFVGHSSHLGTFQTIAWLPWLILGFARSVEVPSVRNVLLTGAAGGVMILAGHFQTSLYSFAALALYALWEIWQAPRRWARAAAVLAVVASLAGLLSAIETLPGVELVVRSLRASLDTSRNFEGALPAKALLTLVYPNALGALSGEYKGPVDITQYYFYAGFLLLPLALIGLKDRSIRLLAAVLAAPCLWYALGPPAGLYRVIALLPGFRSVRAPVQIWFVIALALSLLAAAGLGVVLQRWPKNWVAPVVIAVVLADLVYWNCAQNRLAYARASFDEIYGNTERTLQRVADSQPALTRFLAPDKVPALGPLNGPLDVKLEATYGYNPLKLAAYDQYIQAAAANPKLADGLNVSRWLNMQRGSVEVYPSGLPRAYFARRVAYAASAAESRRMLASLDPAQTTIVSGGTLPIQQDASATAEIVFHDERSLKIRYRAGSDSLLRIAIPDYPGWQAFVDGVPRPTVPADHAFLGVVVPAGSHELRLRFHSTYFTPAAAVSIATVLLMAALAVWGGRPRKLTATQSVPGTFNPMSA